MPSSRLDGALGLAATLFAFAVYALTLAPSVGPMDAGELAAVADGLGVAHPSGYPLYSLLGRAFIVLVPYGTVIWRLNLMGALLCAASAGIFYRLFLFLLVDRSVFSGARPGPARDDVAAARFAAVSGSVALAFSATFWSEGVSAEVYALHLVLLSAASLSFLGALARPEDGNRWALFAYALGLSFSNHLMTLLLLPAYAYLLFSVRGGAAAWAATARAIPPFLLGLTPYVYLPVRARLEPVMNWGDPSAPGTFWYHVSGGQYRHGIFSSAEGTWNALKSLAAALPSEFAYAVAPIAAFGAWACSKNKPRAAVFTFLLFAAGIFYVAAYGFQDRDYRLQACIAAAAWAAFGTQALLRGRGKTARFAIAAACAAAALFPLAVNFREADERGNHAVEDYARDILSPLDSGAVLLTADGANLLSAAAYLQFVEGVRPDVAVLSFRSLGNPRYYAQLRARHPDVAAVAVPLLPDLGGDPDARADLTRLVPELLRRLEVSRPVYVTPDIDPRNAAGFQAAPRGLAMRIAREPLPTFPAPVFARRPYSKDAAYLADIRESYATAYLNHGIFLAMGGDPVAARAEFLRALGERPGFPGAVEWLRRIDGGR